MGLRFQAARRCAGRSRVAKASAEALEGRLLCARNITIADGGTATLAQVDQFADSPGTDLTISPATINAATGNVALRANNDVIFQSGVNIAAAGVQLTVQAGRSVRVGADLEVRTNNGRIAFTANETFANGVVNAQRAVGAAALEMAFGQTSLDAGTGNIELRLSTGAGLTQSTSGNVTIGFLRTFSHVLVANDGPSAGSILSLPVSPAVRASSAAFELAGSGPGDSIGTAAQPITVAPRVVGSGSQINVEGRAPGGGMFIDMPTSPSLLVLGGAALSTQVGAGITTAGGGPVVIRAPGPQPATRLRVTENISAPGAAVRLESGAGLAVAARVSADHATLEAGGDVLLESASSDLVLTERAFLTADVDDNGTGAIVSGAGALVSSNSLNASAATGIDLDTATTTITAATTAAGAITIDEADGVRLTSLRTANGRITVNTDGDTTVTSAVSATDGNANDVVITAITGNLTVAAVDAGATAGDAILRATAGSVFDDLSDATGVRCDVLTLRAAGDIGTSAGGGQLETTARSLDVQSTAGLGAGDHGVFLTETDDLTLTSLTTADGTISVRAGGAVIAQNVAAGGAGRRVGLFSTGGAITVGAVSAADSVFIESSGGPLLDDLNNATRVVGGIVRLVGVRNVGQLGDQVNEIDTAAAELIVFANAGGAGPDPGIFLEEQDGVTLSEVEANAGTIAVAAGGPLNASIVVGPAGGGNVSLFARSGNLTAGSVNAPGSTVDLGAANGSVLDSGTATAVTAATLNLSVLNGVGALPAPDATERLNTAADVINVTSTTTVAPPGGGTFQIRIAEADAVTLQSVQVQRCGVDVTAGGNLALGSVLTADSSIAIDATGNVTDANGPAVNLRGSEASVKGASVGAAGDPIEADLETLGGRGTAGGFRLTNARALRIDFVSVGSSRVIAAGDIELTSSGAMTVRTHIQATAPGNIVLRVPNGFSSSTQEISLGGFGQITTVAGNVSVTAPERISLENVRIQAQGDVRLALEPGGDSPGSMLFATGADVTGSRVDAFGGPGNDTITFSPTSAATQSLTVNGMGGTDVLRFGATEAAVVHATPESVGASAGDTLFRSSRSVAYSAVEQIILDLGSGADTVFVAPSPVTEFVINGGAPTFGAPAVDRLTVATAGGGITHVPSDADTGQFASATRRPVRYDAVEQIGVDAVAPAVVSSAFHFDSGPHRLTYQFNDDVSASLSASDLVLTNTTTGAEVPASNVAVAYDAATNIATFTFPGFAGGVLPNGNYSAVLRSSSVRDFVGNEVTGNLSAAFFALAGDVNRDRMVNGTDFAILAANFGRGGRTFAQGNVNGSGLVDGTDFAILAGNFGRSLTTPPQAIAAAAAPPPAARPVRRTVATRGDAAEVRRRVSSPPRGRAGTMTPPVHKGAARRALGVEGSASASL